VTVPDAPRTHRPAVERLRLGRRGWRLVAGTAGAVWCVALLLWAQHGIDEGAILWAAGLDPNGLLVELARAVSRYGKPVMGLILLAGLVASVRLEAWRPARPVFLLTLLSLAISGVAGDMLKELVDRPRPYVQYPDRDFPAPESTTWSFPSGHSTKAAALALPAILFVAGWRSGRGLVKGTLAVLALAVCCSRVVLGAHFPSDVLGGLAMALSGLPLAVLAANAILRRMTPSDLDRASRIWIGLYVVAVVILLMLS
jgi:membrane-associated phospholipid phosphatase